MSQICFISLERCPQGQHKCYILGKIVRCSFKNLRPGLWIWGCWGPMMFMVKRKYDLKNFHLLWNFGFQPPKCIADVSMKNHSKVLIYSTLLVFRVEASIIVLAGGKIANSDKSELWNGSSYRSLPYIFKVGSQPFRFSWKFWGQDFSFQPQTSFDLNSLKFRGTTVDSEKNI